MNENKSHWTKSEEQKLIELYSDNYNSEISKILNRSLRSITTKSNRLNLEKSKEHKAKHLIIRNKAIGRDITYPFAKKEALKYKSRTEFQIKDSSCYQTARRAGYLDEICSHMIPLSFSIPQMMLQKIMNNILQLQSRYNDRKAIKPYEIDVYYPELKLGFEYNGKGWHQNNSNDTIKQKMCINNGITLIYIKEKSRRYEEDVKFQLCSNLHIINELYNLNITIELINSVDVSSIFESLYDKASLLKIANEYSSLKKFRTEQTKIYEKIIKLNMLDEATSHMTRINKKRNINEVISIINKYTYLLDLIKNDAATYSYIKKNKLDYLLTNLKRKIRYN